MHSVILHKLTKNIQSWAINIDPRFKSYLYDDKRISIVNSNSEGVSFLGFNDKKYVPHIDKNLIETARAISADTLSVSPESLKNVITLEGGFWYRFTHNDQKMVTYIRKKQRVAVLMNDDYVVTVVFNSGLKYKRSRSESLGCRCHGSVSAGSTGQIMELMVKPGQRREAVNEITTYTIGSSQISIIDPYLLGSITGKCEINDKLVNIAKNRNIPDTVLTLLANENGRSFSSVDKFLSYVGRKVLLPEASKKKLLKIANDLYIKNCYTSDLMKAISSKNVKNLNILYSSSHSDNQKVRKEITEKFSGKVTFYDLDKLDDLFIHDRVWIMDSKKAIVVGNSFGGLGMNAISFILPLPSEDLMRLKEALDLHGIKI
ncbi:hypothetical protein [Photobacterium leiognathi]|uniref:hypothetical protein n=1 Tax=Photobacterium leiognathi TaxID=553611 RepID=UPI0029818BAC|nr:hypothetical protein [Photobacterium leiognathi]